MITSLNAICKETETVKQSILLIKSLHFPYLLFPSVLRNNHSHKGKTMISVCNVHCCLCWADFPKVTQSIVGQTKVSAGSSVGFQQPVCLCLSDLAVSHPNFPKTLGLMALHFLVTLTWEECEEKRRVSRWTFSADDMQQGLMMVCWICSQTLRSAWKGDNPRLLRCYKLTGNPTVSKRLEPEQAKYPKWLSNFYSWYRKIRLKLDQLVVHPY